MIELIIPPAKFLKNSSLFYSPNLLFHHTINASTNFTDSRLKSRRAMIYLLKQCYLFSSVGHLENELLKIVSHLLDTNIERRWDIYNSSASNCLDIQFTTILEYIYLQILGRGQKSGYIKFCKFLITLRSINSKNLKF